MTKRPTSIHAQAAKAIRKELKAAFPGTKFSVRSETYSGGNSVSIEWTDGARDEDVKAITDKYQKGTFNGMIDMYENNNSRSDIPQVKFVFTRPQMSEETAARIQAELEAAYQIDMEDFAAVKATFNTYKEVVLWRAFNGAL